MKPSIDEQIEALQKVMLVMPFMGDRAVTMGLVRDKADIDRMVAGYEAALATLKWVKTNAKPVLDALRAEFPGARVAVREDE